MIFDRSPHSADDYRQTAELAYLRGDLTEAVRERFRAVVRELEQRGILDEVSGRTVDEIATQAGLMLPAKAGLLRVGARIFDDVVYGAQPATVDSYRHLAELDGQIRLARPASLGVPH